ncbi:MAG TPA: exo-alpha-sialidase [Thermoanaerobaculia bacterium]|nr:exo-alpha-sialidase [Thermoanaerobaculia bacterium]
MRCATQCRASPIVLAGLLVAGSVASGQEHADRWAAAMAEFERQDAEHPPEPGGILFLGSSSIRFWDLERWLPDHGATNRGFGGSQIADSIRHFDTLVTPHRPAHLVFYAGDNDVAAGKSAEQVSADFATFLTRLWRELPETRVHFIAIKPSIARWSMIDEMRAVNRAVEEMAEREPRLGYVDVDEPMIGRDGEPRRELFVADGLHLSDAGYRLWTSLVAPRLPFHRRRDVFPLETWHNHGSSVVETPIGDLLAVWFHGSGERQADDVAILGARFDRAGGEWSERFVIADTPGFPDTNCTLLVDSSQRLWLFYPTILANTWESALLKVRMAESWSGPGAPEWTSSEVIHMKPGDDFREVVERLTREYFTGVGIADPAAAPAGARRWFEENLERAGDKLERRLGWFTRAHPIELPAHDEHAGRLLVGLYSDGFSFSSATYSDDGGRTWTMSAPIVGGGNVQPSFARRDDGTLVAFMRDNGPPPKRAMVATSDDGGETWSLAEDHADLPEPGAGLEVLALDSGLWVVVHNDEVDGRHSLALSISEDQGRTFTRRRHLERAEAGAGRFHYPSIVQASDGTLHVTYSTFSRDGLGAGQEGKTIRHAHFNEAWLLEAGPSS